jgi:hypothetical protein
MIFGQMEHGEGGAGCSNPFSRREYLYHGKPQ